jgi:hypothetical protein
MSQALLDDDEDDLPQQVPPGIANGTDAEEFHAVETDDDFQPLTGPHAEPEDGIREEADDEQGQQRKSRIARRRAAQRREAEQSRQTIRELQDKLAHFEAKAVEFESFRDRVSPRLDQIDQGRFQEQIASVDREMAANAQRVERAIEAMSEAISTGDTAAHSRALRDHSQAMQKGFELNQAKAHLEANKVAPAQYQPEARAVQPQPRPQQRAVDPEAVRRTQEFVQAHPWFKMNDTSDPDSMAAKAIDQQVAREGYDPAEEDYWDELNARLRQRLPHVFQRRAPARPQAAVRRGPMVSGGGSPPPASNGARQVLMTPGRKQSLITMGVLDPEGKRILDQPKYNRLMKKFHEHDAEFGVGNA